MIQFGFIECDGCESVQQLPLAYADVTPYVLESDEGLSNLSSNFVIFKRTQGNPESTKPLKR
jgi:hypothetical protein